MPEEIISYITNYGYLAIFVLVFLQEIGMPNPFPNEILLMFSGYLSYKGLLFPPFVILTAIFADFLGTSILYFLFYYSGTYIIENKPKWVPLSSGLIDRLSARISSRGRFAIFIFRLTPFTRGYASVITGLVQVKPKVFLPIAFISAGIWSMTYIMAGYLMGPSWNLFAHNTGNFKYFLLLIPAVLICLFPVYFRHRKREKLNEETEIINI